MKRDHPCYLLRWHFEYSDHKPAKYGMWSNPGEFESEQAWCQSKENLLVARIQGKDVVTRQIVDLARCPGADFVNFQWIAAAVQRGLRLAPGGSVMPKRIIGLMIVTRNQKIKIYDNACCEIEEHNIDYSRIHLSGFGR